MVASKKEERPPVAAVKALISRIAATAAARELVELFDTYVRLFLGI